MTCGGTGEVDKMERIVKEIPCPKDAALVDLLDENEEQGRVVIFAGFTGSIDKVTHTCQKEGWDVVRVDGRGWIVFAADGTLIKVDPLEYWGDVEGHPKVAFVAHPKSGGMGLTLIEARMAIYYSNSYESESRIQSEDRIHRMGMDDNRGATIVDLVHLPTDEQVLERLKSNRRLELMTMGELESGFTS
jgi:SNF2 family DNA or RNA helicase